MAATTNTIDISDKFYKVDLPYEFWNANYDRNGDGPIMVVEHSC